MEGCATWGGSAALVAIRCDMCGKVGEQENMAGSKEAARDHAKAVPVPMGRSLLRLADSL